METEGRVVVADFEAGLGTLSRLKPGQVDVFLVVGEPTAKAVELLQGAFGGGAVTLVPEDAAIREADGKGVAAFDHAPHGAAVRALRTLADSLLE